MATAAAIATVVGVGAQILSQRKQRKAAQRATAAENRGRAIQNKQQAISRQREIRQLVAQQRVRSAQLEQAGIASGIQGSSIVAGTTGAVATDTATSVGASNTQFGAATGIANAQTQAAQFRTEAQSPNFFTNLSTVAGLFGNAQFNTAVSNLF